MMESFNVRMLIISHNAFSKVSNIGKTLESLFSTIDPNNIAQLFFHQTDNPDFEFCNNYYKITDIDVLKSLLKFQSNCGGRINKEKEGISEENKTSFFHRLSKIKKYLTLFRDILWKTKTWNTQSFKQWCYDFNPDAIFLVGGEAGFSQEIAINVSKMLNKPLISYYTDDYLIFPKKRNAFDIIQRWRMKSFYKKTITNSLLLFAVGKLMADEYSKYFDRKFYPIMNSVTIQPYFEYPNKSKITISYFGGLHLNRWQMIVRLSKLLQRTREVIVNVYSINKPSSAIVKHFDNMGINYKGAVIGQDLRNAILNSDILLHVESDDLYYRSLTRLSLSTKIPEYLMSGRIVLGFGPVEVASMRLLADNGIGIALSSELDDDDLSYQLNNIVDNYKFRKEIGLKGYEYAVSNYDNAKIVQDFTSKIDYII